MNLDSYLLSRYAYRIKVQKLYVKECQRQLSVVDDMLAGAGMQGLVWHQMRRWHRQRLAVAQGQLTTMSQVIAEIEAWRKPRIHMAIDPGASGDRAAMVSVAVIDGKPHVVQIKPHLTFDHAEAMERLNERIELSTIPQEQPQ